MMNTLIQPAGRLLTTADFDRLADVPAEAEWFANITSKATRRAYEHALRDFMGFVGIARPDEFRSIARAHVIAWRDDLARRGLSGPTVRHRLAALSSLFEHLCNSNAVTHNPVKGVKRPPVDSYEGKTPAIGDHQARQLLEAPGGSSLKEKRDRALLATLLYHALRRNELCRLTVKDFKQERRGAAHLKVSGKGEKTRHVPLHPAASGLILDYLEEAGHGQEDAGALFRPLHNSRTIGSSEIMLRPLIPPTWSHGPFVGAKQRIFMSATLGAGGDLERLTGRPQIKRLPIPDGWDRQGIGRRFFIFPEKSLTEEETLQLRRDLMHKAARCLVLTPNKPDADAVINDVTEQLKYPVFTATDLEVTKAEFIQTEKAVAVIANRYDGIDFPNDDCRLLFIEGLSRTTNLQERFLINRMGASLLFNERIQTRVLQAIGRCTRGLNDYSAVVITGDELPAYLTDRKRRAFFHPELQAELEFGVDQSTKV